MKAFIFALISASAWSQTTQKFVCDQVDIISKKKVSGLTLEVEVNAGKAAHFYSGSKEERELKTSLKFQTKQLIENAAAADLVSEIKKLTTSSEVMTYSTKSDRGIEYFLVAGEVAIHGYKIDLTNPAIKAALGKGAVIENHAFKCKKVN